MAIKGKLKSDLSAFISEGYKGLLDGKKPLDWFDSLDSGNKGGVIDHFLEDTGFCLFLDFENGMHHYHLVTPNRHEGAIGSHFTEEENVESSLDALCKAYNKHWSDVSRLEGER